MTDEPTPTTPPTQTPATATPPATPPATTPPDGQQPPANPDGQPPAGQPPANPPPAEQKPAEQKAAPAASLLDDQPATPPASDQPAPDEEAVKKWTEGVKALDLGDGVTWDDEALGAMTPELMRLSGNDPSKAEGLVKAYATYQQNLRNRIDEANAAYANELVEECKRRFGPDLRQTLEQAKAGGLHVFGETLWKQLRSVPQFANNPDLIERLAAFGRTATPDRGAIPAKDTGAQPAPRDWREGMYGKGGK